ncbi:very-long-chain (3R)-3-hydroxyacyl-CoA dehydratase-like isoform X1 [Pseudomyrmex gracilis]|uniref:very-long-chain (3R)-3-hydroxyacyl-CoA dehydratase-like isoform X1 n=1 Tax=Pseudomyrmex gracilis TaxID=219809 RepID=UPI000994CBB8|nr:very-long-chain (3R)-3-hydroxyacyl-CoA dehydratase-like isoform X1 [Pseudomyrmex gracilis]
MANCPRLVSDYFTPHVVWYDKDYIVVIRIQLSDISDYYLRVDNEYLIFSAIKDDKRYYLVLHLFGPVIAEKTRNKNVGREITVRLIKALKTFPWLRLISSKEKNFFISRDLSELYEIDELSGEVQINEKERLKFQRKALQKKSKSSQKGYILPFEQCSDEDDSDEDETYFSELIY